jgi:predicted enzyme involved in methoxymalonyl-ACP biosynthesis
MSKKNQIIIENFILSCRILGRSIEKKFLNEVLIKLRDKKIKTVVGKYNKSEKNIHCKDFYVNNNFIRKNNKFYFDLKKLKKVKGYVKTIHE